MNNAVQDYLSRAAQAFSAGQYAAAQEICDKVIVSYPNTVMAYVLAGNSCLVRDRFDDAERYFLKSLEMEPENGERYFDYGNCLFGQQRISEALEAYASAIQYGCRDEMMKKIYYLSGVLNQVSGNTESALQNYERSEAYKGFNDDLADILLQRLQIYVSQNDMANAEKCAIQLQLLLPKEMTAYHLLFRIYLDTGQQDKAEKVLAEAKAMCEKGTQMYVEVQFDEAFLYCFLAERDEPKMVMYYNEALRILENIGTITPADKCEATITRAEIMAKLGNYSGMTELAKSVAAEQNQELAEYADRACYLLVECASLMHDSEQAAQYIQRLKESDNLFYRHYSVYMEAYLMKQRAKEQPALKDEAENLYRRAVAYYRNCTVSNAVDFLAYVFRGKCYADLGEYDKALEMTKLLPEDSQQQLIGYIDEVRGT